MGRRPAPAAWAAVVWLLLAPRGLTALPGVAPRAFHRRERVELLVSKVTSTRTQIPYAYYSLPYCRPKRSTLRAEGLGSTPGDGLVASEETRQSPYELAFRVPEACKILCRKEHTSAEMRLFRAMIDNDYRAGWYVDGLPARHVIGRPRGDGLTTSSSSGDIPVLLPGEREEDTLDATPIATKAAPLSTTTTTKRGFPVGFAVDLSEEEAAEAGATRRHFLYNHARLTVSYHEDPAKFEGARIVSFAVEPFSIAHDWDASAPFSPADTVLEECNEMRPAAHEASNFQSADEPGEVIYTYDIRWVKSQTEWSHRWDVYLRASPDDEIHYFSIVNSLMIVLFLTGVVAMILLRTLKKDISAYNAAPDDEEESGWKLVHGDVFRAPSYAPLLALFVGSGTQLLATSFAVLGAALVGVLSPANRGSLGLAVVATFVVMEPLNGFVAAAVATFFSLPQTTTTTSSTDAPHRRKTSRLASLTAATVLAYPAAVALTLGGLSMVVRAQGGAATDASFVAGTRESSTAAVKRSVSTFATVSFSAVGFVLMAGPLAACGAALVASKQQHKHDAGGPPPCFGAPPTRTNRLVRAVPSPPWYAHPLFVVPFGGILPFGAVCIELFFVMSALWLQQIYYVFGFLVVVLVILVATCAEMTIVLTYFQLCHEDHRWQWRAFLSSGSAAVYLFLYAIWYFHAKLDITGTAPSVVYFGYMAIVAATFFLVTGAIGFLAALAFTLTIYAAIKVD